MELLATIIGTSLFVWLTVRWLDKKMYPPKPAPQYSDEQIQKFKNAVIMAQNEIDEITLGDDDHWRITPLDPNEYGYPTMPDEQIFAIRPVQLAEASEREWCSPVASGQLIVTNQALVFMSPNFNTRFAWGQIMWIELLLNGYKIHKRVGLPSIYVFEEPNVNFAVVLSVMHLIHTGRGTKGPISINTFTRANMHGDQSNL